MKLKITFIFFLLFSQTVSALPTAKITIKVIDSQGNPIEGAKTGIGFELPKSIGEGWGVNTYGNTDVSDGDGLFTNEGETSPHVTYAVSKEGYYRSDGKFTKFTGTTGILGFRKYEPWNPTIEVVLKKVIDPIAMYAVNRSAPRPGELPEIPEIGRFVGYDLMVNDWVVPHGLGTHRDLLFKIDITRANSTRDYDVTFTLKFSNVGDGLIEYTPDISKGKSALRFPHHAPVSGYIDELVQHYERTPGIRKTRKGPRGNPDFDTNYFFRVRTELDDKGNVVGGLYGKVHGQIELGNWAWLHKEKAYIDFNYYLNPNNNDTNIEYDPEKNLFKGIPDRLRVTQP